jgi:hypothetical protein
VRVRLTVLLIALLAIVAVPSEAALLEQAGSVVDQVSSCTQPNGVVREPVGDADATGATTCTPGVPSGAAVGLVAVLVALLGAGPPTQFTLRRARRAGRWRRTETLARAGTPWRGPPVAA